MSAPKGLSIRLVLTTVVVTLLLLVSAGVGLNAFFSSRAALDESWHRNANSLADRTSKEAALFLVGARAAVRQAEAETDAGHLDPQDDEAVMAYALRVLHANAHFTWFSWSDESGTLAAALWWPTPEGIVLRKLLRVQRDGGSWNRQWEERDGVWQLVVDEQGDYDPRARPYYQIGAARQEGGVWVDPYLFVTRMEPGVTFVSPSRTPEGALRGVWTSDFECGAISDYLATLKVGETGRVYVLDQSGAVVGHPEGQVAGDGAILNAADHPDPMLASAWKALEAREHAPGAFAFDTLLAAAHAFPEESGIPWTVLTVVPAEELYGAATQEVRRTAIITALLLLVALVLGTVFSQHLARSVIRVEAEMDRIARFDLSAAALADRPSMFREINAMGDAHDRMKQGLMSFGRYVPRQLVEQLMQGGDEARVGGEVREVTVLFCDIAGFTTLVEATPPERLVSALSEYMTCMNRLIVEEEGSVAQYLGDAIVAVWGAPRRVESHGLRATRAAVRMCALVDALIQEAAEKGFPEFHTRIGVYTGPCIVGNIGAEERFNYTILGEARTQAERLEGMNKRYGTSLLICENTAERVGGSFELRPIEEVQTVGGGARFSVYEVLGEAGA